MPKRTDIKKILIIGSGPIVIGQACEFDYSGTQACKALREQGYEVVLVNSNPATIMTDPETADRTYIEPITANSVAKVIAKERPDALLPNMGGQTGLNCAVALAHAGVLDKYGVEVIGCDIDSIETGEDRELFAAAMKDIGLEVAKSGIAHTIEECEAIVDELGYPAVIRPSFTLGGAGGGIAYDHDDLLRICEQGLALSPETEVLVEQSIEGWKEIEMEVMRDVAGNGVIVCSIENLDPMGVHTGDSITVAPCQTLNDYELQRLRDYSIAILERVGVACGGSNVQFAVNPEDGRVIVIEMNPRVSRSSALASKATGFPIAKMAALLSVGYTLDEIQNDITHSTPACFEPSIDYCVVKIPRFAFEKFKGASDRLSTRMKAVGEVMAIGSTFEEAMQKAMRSLEQGHAGLGADGHDDFDEEAFEEKVATPTPGRILYVAEALRRGWGVERVFELTRIDQWFLHRIQDIVTAEGRIRELGLSGMDAAHMLAAKQMGFSDAQIGHLTGQRDDTVRAVREVLGVRPLVKTVDTCAGEFASRTSYHYFTYERGGASEFHEAARPRVVILSAGPNRIGQGIEFDYCCCHAAYALEAKGYETVMVNCNPETVSTDYDTSDRLYFEPLTYEDVMDVIDVERPDGVVVTLGGQTPLKLARMLEESGVNIMGTKPDAIDFAEDRERFAALLDKLGIMYPPAGQATSFEEAEAVAAHIGYPLLVRPSYVLGGRGMMIAYDAEHLRDYMAEAARISPDYPVYLDRFLEGAIESDVDALCDGEEVYIGGILEHIEEAGIHSGDSATCIPPFSFSESLQAKLRETTRRIAMALGVRGLVNVQYAIKGETVYVIEANPRASRTVPFISKATGVPLAKCAARIMAGDSIASLGLPSDERQLDWFCMKEAVMPWGRFPGADVILGPEMKSTGEVMGIAKSYPEAYAKTQLAIDYKLPDPSSGKVFISVCDRDKRHILSVARILRYLGFDICSTEGTARVLRGGNVTCEVVEKISGPHDGERPNIGDLIADGKIAVIVNTPYGPGSRGDGYLLRTEAVRRGVTCVTAMSAANTYVSAIEAVREDQQGHGSANDMGMDVIALQDLPQHTV